MTRRILVSVALFLLGGCDTGTTVLQGDDGGTAPGMCAVDASTPPQPLCTEPIPYEIGLEPSPSGPPPIVIEPHAILAGEITIVSVDRTDDVITMGIDDEGTARTITVLDTAWALDAVPGDVVIARSAVGNGWGLAGDRTEVLVLRTHAGELVAAYIRRIWAFDPNPGALLHLNATLEPSCVLETGGQCGRGVQQLALATRSVRAAQGESFRTQTPEGEIEVAVGALHNDTYTLPGTTPCAVGVKGSIVVDARPAPAAP